MLLMFVRALTFCLFTFAGTRVSDFKSKISRKLKTSRSKKCTLEGGKKRKTPDEQVQEQTPHPELKALKQHEAPKKLEVSKKT